MSGLDVAVGAAAVVAVQALWSLWRAPRIKVDEEGNWHFPVHTFEQMLAIPAERRERFLAELPATLRHVWAMQAQYPVVSCRGIVWVDDNKGEFRPHVVNAPENAKAAFHNRPLSEEPAS